MLKLKIGLLLSMITGILVLSAGIQTGREDIGASAALAYFSAQAIPFAQSSANLLQAVQAIDRDSATVLKARKALLECRLCYKRLSFFSSYFFPSETAMYNAAPKYEVEEPELELVEPMGLQQIEALLFGDDVYSQKAELIAQAAAFNSSVADLKNLLYQFKATDPQVLESLRIELVRIIALYISGYDAPSLKSGISEAMESSKSMEVILEPYFRVDEKAGQPLRKTLHQSIVYLQSHQDFDSFDRMEYLRTYALPLQEQLSSFIRKESLELNTTAYLNPRANHLFSPEFLESWDSIAPQQREELTGLGRKLFFDEGLSGDGKRSCATCHQPENYFTDGLSRSASMLKDSLLSRNTPTLLYAGLQHTQFWDGRAKTMAAQIRDVLFNPLEMASNSKVIVAHLKKTADYTDAFSDLPDAKPEAYLARLAEAITAYLSGLKPLNSPFDQYLAGNNKGMNRVQVRGFNLFMGKAQCGTCHFVPYFNSLVPPFYDRSELEILGTTKDDNFAHPRADADPGRYELYKIRYYRQAFKTPTVRNAAKTGPYMHNGNFKTLESVVEFYNKGGAAGLGLSTPDQTLSSRPLQLSEADSQALIQFIHSLTDSKISQ